MPHFDQLRGGLQIKALPPASTKPDKFSASFKGWTVQLDNIRWSLLGLRLYGSTLGKTVRDVFNQEVPADEAATDPMVPLERIELSGYGASIFSNYLDSTATIADVSQVQFDVVVGRTGHEVVQVRSILYPFGVHVVRTITLHALEQRLRLPVRLGMEGGERRLLRVRLHARPEGDGRKVRFPNPYEFHAQPVKGVSNVREIRDFPAAGPYTSSFTLADPDLPPELQALSLRRVAAGLRQGHQQESHAATCICRQSSSTPTCTSTTSSAAAPARGPTSWSSRARCSATSSSSRRRS